MAKAKKTQDKKAAKKAARVNGKKNATKAPKTADKKAAPAPAPRPTYDRSHRQVEHEILSKAAGPMNARQLSEIMVADGQISGRTPQATVGRDLCMTPDMFGKVARGKYVALDGGPNGKTPLVIIKGKAAGTLAAYTKKFKGNGNGKAAPAKPAPVIPAKPADKKTGNGKPKAAPAPAKPAKAAPKKTDNKSTKAPAKGA